jgi:hypothetical protein
MTRGGWLRRLACLAGALCGLAAGPSPAQAADPAPGRALYLVGEDWVGRWQDGGLAATADLAGTTVDSVVADEAGGVWLMAWPNGPANSTAGPARLSRRAAATLVPLPVDAAALGAATKDVSVLWPAPVAGRLTLVRTAPDRVDGALLDAATLALDGPWRPLPADAVRPRVLAGGWLAPAPLLVGLDSEPALDPARLLDAATLAPVPVPAWLRPPARLLAVSRTAALVLAAPDTVRVVGLDDGAVWSERRVAAPSVDQLRGALSPDGSTAVVFIKPPDGAGRWPGTAWGTRSGRPLPSDALFIDDGSGRDPAAPRSLACLLPAGAGAIFTRLGPPADRESEAVLLDGPNARRFPLNTAYVQRCVLGEPIR